MLLLGGFSIAAALSKHFIAKQMAVAVLSRVGRLPRNVLLASMFVAAFASMWISNVAAPVLCFSLFQPILRTMDVTTPFAKSLVMGECVGGQSECSELLPLLLVMVMVFSS
jgi:di/tricarboxylate transporter